MPPSVKSETGNSKGRTALVYRIRQAIHLLELDLLRPRLWLLGPRFRKDERGENSPDFQPFVPAEAGTQCCTNRLGVLIRPYRRA